MDSYLREINFANKALALTMTNGADIGPLELVSDNTVVGAVTTQKLSFATPVPLSDGSRIYISIPIEVGTPSVNSFSVKSALPIDPSFASNLIGNKISITVKTDPSVGLIKAGTKLQFTFGPLTNPQSMAPSSPYSVRIDS